LGLSAKGLQTDITFLKAQSKPVILHVIIDKKLAHYVVCYGFDAQKQQFCIGDPAKGIISISENELSGIWQSNAIISIEINENFILQKTQQNQKIKYFLAILQEDYPVLMVSAVLGLVISVLGLSMAIFSQKLIDEILPNKNTEKLISGIVLLTLLLFIKAFLGYVRGFFLNKQSQSFNNRLVGGFLDKLMFLPLNFFQNRKTGDLIARLNDTRRIQQNIIFLTGSLIIDVLVIIISSFFIFNYHWLIGLITLACVPLYVGISFGFSKKILTAQKQVLEASARNESNYIDVIQGVSTIKSFQKEGFFLNNTKNIYEIFQEAIFRLGKVGLRFGIIVEFLGVITLVGIVSVACVLIVKNTLKVGELMAILSVVGSIVPAIIRISTANIPLQEAKIAFDRMYEFTSLPQEKNVASENTLQEPINTLSVENISFRFAGRKTLFQNASFTAQKGEFLGVVGENGVGKSTLFQIIQRFYEQENGHIFINNINASEINTQILRSKLAVVPQEVKIFSGTLLENICLDNPQEHFEKVIVFCKKLGFEPYFLRLPQGYFTILGEQGVHLSGGQK
jgi:ATP-binding cassette, subfamily C, bacteriocin exporter